MPRLRDEKGRFKAQTKTPTPEPLPAWHKRRQWNYWLEPPPPEHCLVVVKPFVRIDVRDI